MAKKSKKKEGIDTKITENPEKSTYFTWKDGTKIEKFAFITAIISLLCSVAFLVFEFIYEYEEWPYICFDIAIAVTFAFDAITNLHHHKGFAIFSFILAVLFLAYGIYKTVLII